jgi:putative toxin-antitoxin system antitoxin component (TIGR02293 family)
MPTFALSAMPASTASAAPHVSEGAGALQVLQRAAAMGSSRTDVGQANDLLVQLLQYGRLPASAAHALVKQGLPSSVVPAVASYFGLPKGEIAQLLGMDRTTANRRIARGENLPGHVAEAIVQVMELAQLAEDIFETGEQASQWMRRPHPMLEGDSPLACAGSAYGAQRVRELLNAIKYGGVA